MKNIIVFYHKNCPDGFGAAWVAWKKFGNKAEYIGLEPRRVIIPKLKDKTIYFLDVLCNERDLKRIVKSNEKVVVIDHHASRANLVKFASKNIFSLRNDASVLSFKYFFPDKPVPQLFLIIEDYDLWLLKRSHTKEFMAVLDGYKFDFSVWSRVIGNFESAAKRRKYLERGKFILGYLKRAVELLVKAGDEAMFAGKRVLVVNSPILESEIGHYIVAKKGFPIGIVWSEKNGQISVSLRSRPNLDVSKIAQRFGGGGHPQAAGFGLKSNTKFPWRLVKKKNNV